VRASIAAALTAASIIALVVCLYARVPALATIAPLTLAFVAACVGVLGVTEEEATRAQRVLVIAALVVSVIVTIAASALFLHALDKP
jgi:putative effector of murein hydrolase LrgA (UPF0299 family)